MNLRVCGFYYIRHRYARSISSPKFPEKSKSVGSNRVLFELFAQGHGHRLRDNQLSLRVDWGAFCRKSLEHDNSGVIGRWYSLVVNVMRIKPVVVPTSMPMFDGSFKRSFQVGLSLTTRALILKGVSPDIVSRTRMRLRLIDRSDQNKDVLLGDTGNVKGAILKNKSTCI